MRVIRWTVVAMALWCALRAMDALLSGVQVDGLISGDVESIAWGQPLSVVDHTTALLQTWAAPGPTRSLITAVMLAYFVVDALFIGAYLLLLRALYTRVAAFTGAIVVPRSRRILLWVVGLADLGENVARLGLYFQVGDQEAHAWPVLVFTAYVFTLIKFGGLVVALWFLLEWLRKPELRTLLRAPLRVLGRALWRLRLAVVATGLFAAVVLFEPTGQALDLIRRWADDGAFPGTAAVAAAGVLLLGAVTWWTTRRLVLSNWSQASATVPPCVLVVAGFLVIGAAASTGWKALWGPGLVLAVLGVLSWFAPVTVRQEAYAEDRRRTDAGAPLAAERNRVEALARGLAVVPLVALMAAAVTAFTPVMFVLPAGGRAGTTPFLVAAIVLGVAFVLTPVVAVLGIRGLQQADLAIPVAGNSDPALTKAERVLLIGGVLYLVFVLVIAMIADFAAFSALPVVAAFLSLALLALTAAQRLAERVSVPAGLLYFGLSRTPVTSLLVVVFVVSSLGPFNDGSSHAAHHLDGAAPGSTDLARRWTGWKSANCADRKSGVVPLVLVASAGGGQRAAYWTASALTRLFSTEAAQPGCPQGTKASAVFAVGGASGGSFGNTSWATALATGGATGDWYRKALLAHDYLADPFAWMLTVDLARAVVGFPGPDRARRLEERWEDTQPELARDFFAGGDGNPLLLLTGTQVESGCRLSVSPLRLVQPGEVCGGIADGAGAPATADLLDYVCDSDGNPAGSISRSTAALLSARFPYVSPSAQLYRCGDGARIADVDGGYADNTGTDSVLALWQRLEPLVAEHNRTSAGATVVPVFVMLDNHYRSIASKVPPPRTQELFVPLSTSRRTDALDDLIAEQRARAAFTGPIPGRPGTSCPLDPGNDRFLAVRPTKSPGLEAPLAWSLSALAIDDLDAQRDTALGATAPTALSNWLKADRTPCG